MVTFHANAVVVDDSDDDFIFVGFADEQTGEYGEALHFQRAYEFDEQDIELGMDAIYIERGIQSGAHYGGIESVKLYRDRVTVCVHGATARSLGDSEFEITFSISEKEFSKLRHGFQIVFRGFEGLSEPGIAFSG